MNFIAEKMRLFISGALLSASCLSLPAHAEQIPIQVLSATIKDQRIYDAEVILQRNGAPNVVGRTNNQGQVTLGSQFADDNSNLLIVKKADYSNLVVKCPCKDMTYAISPVMNNLDGVRIVLTWGKYPDDLDSHLVFPGNSINFKSKMGADAWLDVDDTNSYGPETITIDKKHFGEKYVYAVHNYSKISSPRSTSLSDSEAKVFVYMGQTLLRTYYVPKNREGNLWTVFGITDSGDFQDFDSISGISETTSVPRRIESELHMAPWLIPPSSNPRAKELNLQGETAYRAGNLEQAIKLYRQAIDLDPNYSQIYSNLGLAFQKNGNTAESIWANRRAITLARGNSAATTRASSYYNIARIYEAAEQFSDARRHYELAREQKANPVYDRAIERVRNR